MSERAGDLIEAVLRVVRPFVPRDVDLGPDTPLLNPPLIDSLNVIQVLVGLESELGLSLGAADISMDDFVTCRRLAETVAELKGS